VSAVPDAGRERLARAALYLGGFLGPFGGGVIVVLVPELQRAFDASAAEVTAGLTVYLLPFAALQLVSGTIGERLGRARTIRWAFVIYAVASFGVALAPAIVPFLALRAVQGAANAFTTPLLLAALAETTPPERLGRSMGTFASVQTAGLVMAVWWAATDEERTATYQVRGPVTAITLDIGEADLQIVGGGGQAALQVSHTDRFSFNHPAESERVVRDGELRLRSRCPAALIGSCSSAYRLRVPDNVPVRVRTTSGDVSSSGYRGSATVDTTSGSVDFDGWCGFNLQVRADVGDVRATASCTPQRLQLRSRAGSVQALVPPGRYRVDAESDEGKRSVRGVSTGDDAPFQVQALSTTGDVRVGSGP